MPAAVDEIEDTRVLDFLNDKIQTDADLGTLDTLLASVKGQQDILRQQLLQADRDIEAKRDGSQRHTQVLQSKIQDFRTHQERVHTQLNSVTTSQHASDVVLRFQQGIENLRQLDIAKGYISILYDVNIMSQEAKKQVLDNPQAALTSYHKIRSLSVKLKTRQEEAEGAAVHLIEFVDQAARLLWDDLKNLSTTQFQAILSKMGWPKTDIPEESVQGFEDGFSKILILKNSVETDVAYISSANASIYTSSGRTPLLAFDVLAKPLGISFRYHYEGDRPTNRVDKPEWYLAHILNLVKTYNPLFSTKIQYMLDDNNMSDRDALHEFTTALFPILRKKIDRDLPLISAQAPLTSYFVQELMKFDAVLREEYMYSPFGVEPDEWKGLTHDVLTQNNNTFFGTWLNAEKDFALSRYETIIAASDAWTIDYDSVDSHETKPTRSAIRLKDLIETVTEHYKPLKSFSQCLKFLIEIQVAILDQYHDRLRSSVEAFVMLSSSLGRAVHGKSSEADSVGGVGGLERLCRVYGSSAFLEACMLDWSEDVFFLELWDALQRRTQSENRPDSGVESLLGSAQHNDSSAQRAKEEGTLFEETSTSFRRLRDRVENLIYDLVVNALKDDMKPYIKISQWTTTYSEDAELSPSPELVTLLKSIPLFNSFLSKALSPIVFQQISQRILASIETHLIDNVIWRHQFSEQGGKQLSKDMFTMWDAYSSWLPQTENLMRKLYEICLLLRIPHTIIEGEDDQAKSLRHVVDLAFESNDGARQVADELGLYILTTQEIRNVLEKRTDTSI